MELNDSAFVELESLTSSSPSHQAPAAVAQKGGSWAPGATAESASPSSALKAVAGPAGGGRVSAVDPGSGSGSGPLAASAAAESVSTSSAADPADKISRHLVVRAPG